MRGRIIPAAFLVLAMAAAACLPASRRDAHWAGGWQTAGVDARTGQDGGNAAAGKVLVEAVGSFVAGGPAEAQGRDGAGAQGTRSARTERPRFSRITIAPGKEANFSGSGPSGGEVTLRVNGKLVGTTRIDGNGKWQMTAPALGAGDHRVRLSVERSGDTGGGSTGGQEVRIAIPEGVRGSEIVAFEDVDRADVHAEPPGSGVSDVRIRDHAERLAREASREFDVFTDREQAAREERRRVAQSEEEASTAEDHRRERNGPLGFDPLAPVEEWFSQSARDYYDYVVPELARKGPR